MGKEGANWSLSSPASARSARPWLYKMFWFQMSCQISFLLYEEHGRVFLNTAKSSHICLCTSFCQKWSHNFGTSGGVPIGWRSCSQYQYTFYLKFDLFLFLFSVFFFSRRRSDCIKKLILWKLTGAPKTLGVNTFLGAVSQFGAP